MSATVQQVGDRRRS